ncbi:MAG: RNA polymerase sigma-70 factor [Bacteroidales bacterium]|nr:RNA polymerase sigma-70 factor [Bacteroidales bacterium]
MTAEAQINDTRFDSLFELIYVRNRKMFERLAYFQIGNEEEAKDLVSKCFLSLWEHQADIREDQALAYMFTIVRNACMDYRRSDTRHKKIFENIQSKERGAMEYYSRAIESCDPKRIFADEIMSILSDTLKKLPENQRNVFIKNRVEGLSYKETAEALGLTYKQVDKSMQTTIRKLKLALGEYLPFFLLFLNQLNQ